MSAAAEAGARRDPPVGPYCPECNQAVTLAATFGQSPAPGTTHRVVHPPGYGCSKRYTLDVNKVVWLTDEAHAFREWCKAVQIHLADLGRPFKDCVYCGEVHFTPRDKNEKIELCTRERFVRGIVYTFPSLRRDCPGLTPWDAVKWARWWRTSGARTSGSHHAVCFVLSVWSGGNKEWKRKGLDFDCARAFGSWDQEHRAAFLKWAERPWWP